MPIYEYRCGACDSVFEILQNINEENSVQCPHCGADHPERILSLFSSASTASSNRTCGTKDFT